jgi:hypothetical protein
VDDKATSLVVLVLVLVENAERTETPRIVQVRVDAGLLNPGPTASLIDLRCRSRSFYTDSQTSVAVMATMANRSHAIRKSCLREYGWGSSLGLRFLGSQAIGIIADRSAGSETRR